MNDWQIAAIEEEARVRAESFKARREILEDLLLNAEQAISRAQHAVNRSRLVRQKIAARRARLKGGLTTLERGRE
jgi:hypothetical protein